MRVPVQGDLDGDQRGCCHQKEQCDSVKRCVEGDHDGLTDQRKPPASRKAQKRRSLPLAPSIRLRNERPLSTTNGNGGAASLNGRAKRPPGRRTVNAGSRPSTRRRLRWTRPSRSTRSGPPPSRPRPRLSRRDRKPKKPAGIKRRSDWRLCCSARGVRGLGWHFARRRSF